MEAAVSLDEEALERFRQERQDLQMDVLREVEAAVLVDALETAITLAAAAEIRDLNEKAAAAMQQRRMNMSEDQRIAEVAGFLGLLKVERVRQRRKLGNRIVFLNG